MHECDPTNYGFVIISNFYAKLLSFAQETDAEVRLRRFARSVANQNINLLAELSSQDTQRKRELEQV